MIVEPPAARGARAAIVDDLWPSRPIARLPRFARRGLSPLRLSIPRVHRISLGLLIGASSANQLDPA